MITILILALIVFAIAFAVIALIVFFIKRKKQNSSTAKMPDNSDVLDAIDIEK